MKIIRIRIIKECKNPNNENKTLKPGKVVTFSGDKVKVGKQLIKDKKAEHVGIKRVQVDSKEQAEQIIEKLNNKSK